MAAAVAALGLVAAPGASAAPSPGRRPPVAGSIGVRLVDAPVAARNDPRARFYIVDHLAPGSVIRRRIEVSNTTAATARIALYPAAATIAKSSFLGAAGHTANDLSTWTSVRPGTADIAAGGRTTATVTIAVPRDAAPGEQYGVVWAEVHSAPAAGGVTQVSRVGIRLYVSVGPGGAPAANFTIDSLTALRAPGGRPVVMASVHNTGGRALDMSGSLSLSARPGGLRAGPFPADLGVTLAIGDTEPIRVVLDRRLPNGPWAARISLRSGLLERNARATLTFPTAGAAPAVRPEALGARWRFPTWAAFLLLLVLVTVAVLLLTVRRRRRLPAAGVPGRTGSDALAPGRPR